MEHFCVKIRAYSVHLLSAGFVHEKLFYDQTQCYSIPMCEYIIALMIVSARLNNDYGVHVKKVCS